MFKMDLKNFKKISSDEHKTVMQHKDGHSIHIAHKALSPEAAKQLHAIPLHKGKEVKQSNPKLEESKKSPSDPTQEHLLPGDKEQNKIEKQLVNKNKGKLSLDKGGDIKDLSKMKDSEIGKTPLAVPKKNYDEGGEVPKATPEPFKFINQRGAKQQQEDVNKANLTTDINKADGGEVEKPLVIEPAPEEPAPLDVVPASDNEMSSPAEPAPMDIPPVSDAEVNKAAQAILAPSPNLSLAQFQNQSPSPEQPLQQMPNPAVSYNAPMVQTGYDEQKQGIAQQAEAEGQLGRAQAAQIEQGVKAQQSLKDSFQKNFDQLNKERLAHIDDINAEHIDPKNYWKDHNKLLTGIGIILAGFNPTGRPNAAIEFLNHQMEQNLRAQAENLQSKQNLLNANLHQFGNMRDAVEMTRVMQSDMVANQLRKQAALSADPLAKARALQAAGQLDAQAAPMFLKLSVLRTLQGPQQNNPNRSNPAAYVEALVPKEHQEAVYKEVERAQNTRNMANEILRTFDKAAKEQRIMSGGNIKNLIPGVNSASLYGLHQAMQPTFGDLEGTVRQAAMDNTFKNVSPQAFDSDKTIADKRRSLEHYLKSKSSAPRAYNYGIDLDKFSSTTTNPVTALNPQQRSFYDWAKDPKNANDPRAALILRKLGLE